MSKLFTSKKYQLKPIKQPIPNNIINQSMQNTIDPYLKNPQGIIENFSLYNKDNISTEYSRHYSPPGKSNQSLPSITIKTRKNNKTQKKSIKTLSSSNSSKNIYSKSLFGPVNKKKFEREKTSINIMENNLEQNKRELSSIEELDDIDTGTKINKLNNGVTQINNITNINIHIYPGNENNNINQNKNKTIDNLRKNELMQNNNPIITEYNRYQNESQNSIINNNNINPNNISYQNQNTIFKGKQILPNNNYSSLIGNAGLSLINNNNSTLNQKRMYNIPTIFNKNNEKNKKTIKLSSSNNSSNYSNIMPNNSMSTIGSIIMNNNNIITNQLTSRGVSQNKLNNNRYKINNSLPEINKTRSISMNKRNIEQENNINILLKEDKNLNGNNHIENIDISMNFLKDLSIYYLIILKIMEIIYLEKKPQIV